MENTVTDKFGTWVVQKDGAKRLIEEAPEWIAKQEELDTSVTPSQEDLDKAKRQIETINTLMEVGLL